MRKHYRNCDELPIFNFYKVMETQNHAWLYLDYDGFDEKKSEEGLEHIWQDIYDEYIELSGDNTSKFYYELINEVLYLETRYKVALELLKQLSKGSMSENNKKAYIEELKRWKYKINPLKPLEEELNRMVKQLKASENKIRIKNNELKQLKNQSSINDKLTLVQQKVKLEQALSRNNIDTKITVVSNWIALIKEVESINNSIKKSNGK